MGKTTTKEMVRAILARRRRGLATKGNLNNHLGVPLTLLATVVTFFRHWREYNWRLGFPFLLCVSLGVPIGVFFLEKSSETLLIKVMATTMLLFAAREFLLGAETKSIPGPFVMPLGLFSGALSGAFNLGGIPSAATSGG